MLTNPNTLGLFEEDIAAIAAAVHGVGGLLYYYGAISTPSWGLSGPATWDSTSSTWTCTRRSPRPMGEGARGRPGGGVGATGPLPSRASACPFLRRGPGGRLPLGDTPRSIGRMHSWHGNALVLARALAYILVNGGDGLREVAEAAVLNANWLRQRLSGPFDVPFDRPCMHEVVLSTRSMKQAHGVHALDVAKRLLEEGFHSPTVYFPLIVEEALMIEPTETESPQTLAALADSLERIALQAEEDPDGTLAGYPLHTPVRRVDEARAARTWSPPSTPARRTPNGRERRHLHHPIRRSLPAHPQVPLRTERRSDRKAQQRRSRPASHHHRSQEREPRTNGLTYCRDRGDIIVVASNGGSDRSPAWLLNLQAEPRITVRVGRQVMAATARVAGPRRGNSCGLWSTGPTAAWPLSCTPASRAVMTSTNGTPTGSSPS